VQKQIAKASRKHAKHNPQARPKLKRDPGVPSKFPFKDKVIREIEQGRKNHEKERQQQRERSRQLHLQSQGQPAHDAMQVDNSSIARLAQAAEERDLEYQDGIMAVDDTEEITSSAKRDTSRKAYNKEFKKVIEQADVILYILDARDPEVTRSRAIEKSIRESPNGEKQLVLILNKIGTFRLYVFSLFG
jgi:nuclear GTP-binding protein